MQEEVEPIRYPKQRRYRRFDLQVPVCLTFPSAGSVSELAGMSENVSLGGLLLKAPDQLPLRTQVNLTIKLISPWSHRSIRLHSEAEVVRVEALEPGDGYAIAVECKRPMQKIEDHLRAAS